MGRLMVIGEESVIDELSSISGVISCIHFRNDTLQKGIYPSGLRLPNNGLNIRIERTLLLWVAICLKWQLWIHNHRESNWKPLQYISKEVIIQTYWCKKKKLRGKSWSPMSREGNGIYKINFLSNQLHSLSHWCSSERHLFIWSPSP